jgi:S-DNA-T family DNA segregation ATPase FtsK/SpoIIIE
MGAVRLYTPTQNHRLNELIGFLILAVALTLLLSLVSYHPSDPSFNTVSGVRGADPARNWIGLIGAYLADALFQAFGFPILLLPVAVGYAGVRWFRGREIESGNAKVIGVVLLILSLDSLLTLFPYALGPKAQLLPGGLTGILLASWLRHGLNAAGAYLVTLTVFFVSLFLSTRFSFAATRGWLAKRIAVFDPLRVRIQRWRETRARKKALQVGGAPALVSVARSEAPVSRPSGVAAEMARPRPVLVRPETETGEEEIEALAAPRMTPRIARTGSIYRLPSPSLLRAPEHTGRVEEDELKDRAQTIISKCEEFGVKGTVTQVNPGPVVTTYEYKPEAGIKYSRIASLVDDLCLALRAESILIERLPGKATVGIEVPNLHRETIYLREIIESPEFSRSTSKLTLTLGKDLTGHIRVADLGSMPHVLIAGSTGSGKSVMINSMILSMLYKATPEEVKFILVDPKRLELGLYEGVPHLFTPIVTDARLAANALKNATHEMEHRLKLLAQRGVRNIEQYNALFKDDQTLSLFSELEEDEEHAPLPYIVIVIDELADLMMIDQPNPEESITRIAQMARAVGIHLILSTQRPSVDVITGLIKANFPARMSFRVATKVDSRTILDANGAEALLGNGDMLYLPAGSARLHRLHGPLVTESEIVHVCDFWRGQSKPQYHEEFLRFSKDGEEEESAEESETPLDEYRDELYDEAVRVVCEMGRASTSTLQRRLRIGYGRAARLIDMMEQEGIVGPADGAKPREVLKKLDYYKEFDDSIR